MSDSLLEAFAALRSDPDGLSRIRPALRFAKVKPTNNCNSRCITCTYWEHKYENELTLDEVKGVLNDLRAAGVEELTFSGGEPSLRRDLPEMVAHARELGFNGIGMISNCLSLGESRIDQLIDAGLTEAVLSLEGLDRHDEIRGVPGNAAKVVRALAHFAARRDGGARVKAKLATTLMNRTLDQVEGVVDLARRHGAGFFLNLIDGGTYFFEGKAVSLFTIDDRAALNHLIDRLLATKQAEPELIASSVASLEYARRYFDDPKQAHIPCALGYVGVDIDSNGDVYANCWGLPKVGNLRRTPLPDILDSEEYLRRCQAMYRKQCGGCSCGYILNLAYHPETAAGGHVGFSGES